LLWDERRRCIALLHAGWRGTSAGILGRALQQFTAQGSKPADLWVGLGPSIGPCCYPVSEDVAAHFPAEALQRDASGGVRADLRHANRRQALDAGVPAEQVLASPPCTGCNGDTFFSYRKQGARSGRMWALAWMRPDPGA
jgi:YfiH family protein